MELALTGCWYTIHLLDDELADLHAFIENDWGRPKIHDLECDRASKSCMDRRCREMNKKTEAGERTLAFDTRGKAGFPRSRSAELRWDR